MPFDVKTTKIDLATNIIYHNCSKNCFIIYDKKKNWDFILLKKIFFFFRDMVKLLPFFSRSEKRKEGLSLRKGNM